MTRSVLGKREYSGVRWRLMAGLVVLMLVLAAGCSLDGLLGTDELPPDVVNPENTGTFEGAERVYYGTLAQFRDAFDMFVRKTAVLTDELHLVTFFPSDNAVDMRRMPEGEVSGNVATIYSLLQKVRGQASQAIVLLTGYSPDSVAALTGHMYAMQAYAEIFLAELFCSGIPLSTVNSGGGFTYKQGVTTEKVYQNALTLLDSALSFVSGSARLEHLVRVGQARALRGLGRFADAANAVAEVPDDYTYNVEFSAVGSVAPPAYNFARLTRTVQLPWLFTVGNREGINGLAFRTSGGPRAQVTLVATAPNGVAIYHPDKYATDGSTAIVLASGIEARLVEAEAMLGAGNVSGWLDKLNHLRRTAWPAIEPAVEERLPDLTDPGTREERVDLLYRERALWLLLTGQRQGDLRVLIRHYGRTQDRLYPKGPYNHPAASGFTYGSHVDLPVPLAERVSNPKYAGCISRG